MQLKKVYFDAYKSLLDTELEITDSCIGLVGINESGKSNVLNAIGVLSLKNPLTIADTPRMARDRNPALRFEFQPNNDERKVIEDSLIQLCQQKDVPVGILREGYTVVYHVSFDRERRKEAREFTIQGVSLPAETMVLKAEALTEQCMFMRGESFIPLKNAILIEEAELQTNEKLAEKSISLNEQIEGLKFAIEKIKESEQAEAQKSQDAQPTEIDESQAVESNEEVTVEATDTGRNSGLQEKEAELASLIDQRDTLVAELSEFDINNNILLAEEKMKQDYLWIQNVQSSIDSIGSRIAELQEEESLDEEQIKELTANKRKQQTLRTKLQKLQNSIGGLERTLEALRQPVREKYSCEPDELSRHLSGVIRSVLETRLPNVVLWQGTEKYILKGETEFESMFGAQDLNEISRPLVNLFRIGLNIETLDLDALKAVIAEIRDDPSERPRYEDKLNKRVNKYIQSVWPEYDQKLKISLEQERMLVRFYDPKCESASYFSMEERSQGCQTFISFLLTVGAEAKKGVIRDTVLLLDEPESHLHPSGVRFMLQELIKAAANGNKVVFATHSIFMIDRDCYDRHVIVKKEKEQTIIQPSRQDRIGFFMQEEVLYLALDINLSKDFNSTNRYNFVFEGDGDARLFEHFYSFLNESECPFDLSMTSFYQGGKCSDIMKYFKSRPIQLGSVWVFVLDSDKVANNLKGFLEKRYESFLEKDIFIFQYDHNDWSDEKVEVELEDLLPESIIMQAITTAVSDFLENEEATAITAKVDGSKPFGKYFKEICSDISDVEQFKGAVKSALNRRIAEQVERTKTKQDFDKMFTVYSSWAQSVVDRISSLSKLDTTQHNTPKEVTNDDHKAGKKQEIKDGPSGDVGSAPIREMKKKSSARKVKDVQPL